MAKLVPVDDRDSWLAWFEGLADWKVLSEFDELFDEGAKRLRHPPMPPPRPALKNAKYVESGESNPSAIPVFAEDDLTAYQIKFDDKRFIDKRLNRRFLRTFQVFIDLPEGPFVTSTVDVSTTGLSIREAIRETAAKEFRVRLTRKRGAWLELRCKPIISPRDGSISRMKIISSDSDDDAVLITWLLDESEV